MKTIFILLTLGSFVTAGSDFQYLMQDDPIKTAGERILNGEYGSVNFESLLTIMRQRLTTSDSIERLFYFRVFGKICEQADGAVGEIIGESALKYLKLNPKEFIINSRFISDRSFHSIGVHVGEEFYNLNENTAIEEINRFIKQMYDNCKGLDQNNAAKLDQFVGQMRNGLETFTSQMKNYKKK
jgi:hypothetical protein